MDKDNLQALFQNSFKINKDAIIFFSASENTFAEMGKVMQRQIKYLHSICKAY